MVKQWISIFLSGVFALGAESSDPLAVQSGEVHYQNKEIILVGQVTIQHRIGQIAARHLLIRPLENKDSKGRSFLITMRDDVQVDWHGGGRLMCQQAEVDYRHLKGVFLGNEASPDVIYVYREEDPNTTLQVKSQKMDVDLLREEGAVSENSKLLVQSVQATGNVRTQYAQSYQVRADQAVYQRTTSLENLFGFGELTLTAGVEYPLCQMTTNQGDHVEAEKIHVDLGKRVLTMEQVKGHLMIPQHNQDSQQAHFMTPILVWQDQDQALFLRGPTEIVLNEGLTVHTNGEMVVTRTQEDPQTLQCIRSARQTEIMYVDKVQDMTHYLYCPGPLLMDHEHREIILQGLDEQGKTQQVYLEDPHGEMYADRVWISYILRDRQMILSKVVLEGRVRLFNRFDGHVQESGSVLNYALTDRLEYFPDRHEMMLIGMNGNRVLFFDKVNQVQVSAPSLKITHDPTTKKESIQGLGDVRFTFVEQEFEQMKRHFRLEEPSEASAP